MTTHGSPVASAPRALLALSGDGPLGQIAEGLRALVEVWFPGADAPEERPGGGRRGGVDAGGGSGAEAGGGEAGSGADVCGAADLTDDQLVDAVRAIARLERSIESLKLQCSSAIARRSVGESRHEGLAGRHGFATPERFIAATTGASTAEAAKLVAVAAATVQPESFGGAAARGPRYPRVAAAIAAGSISVEIAHRITEFLDSVRLTVDAPQLESAEHRLVERAGAVGVDGLHRYFKLMRAELDRPGVRVREVELHARRSLRIWEDRHGLIHLRGCFDPATAAPIKLAVETLVSADLHAARDAKSRLAAHSAAAQVASGAQPVARPDAATAPSAVADAAAGSGAAALLHAAAGSSAAAGLPGQDAASRTPLPDAADRAFVDDRTIEQMAADALADIARLAAAASDAPPALASASVVVRLDLDDLEDALGFAIIDDIEQPVSATTARAMAASAGVIPMVCGSDGEVLDLGRRRRFFTRAQRIALAERDGGCAHPDCARPIAHTQAHHLRWWDAHDGPTDLENGVLLCAFHHWCIHHDGWQVFTRDGGIWFVPPSHLDPEQRPRPGRRTVRLELMAA